MTVNFQVILFWSLIIFGLVLCQFAGEEMSGGLVSHLVFEMRHHVSVLNFGINNRILKRLLDLQQCLQLRRHPFSSLANSNKPSVDSPSRKWNVKKLWIAGLGALAVSVGGIAHARISRPKSTGNAANLNVILNESEYIEVPSLESGFSGEVAGIYNYEQHFETVQTPWELVSLTRSNDGQRRRKGTRSLAKLQNLHVSCCQQIAQCLDMRASVGLARTAGSDLRMLLLPPKYSEKFDLRTSLYDLLTRLPIGSVDQCVHHITVSTLKETFRNVENLNSEAYYGEITSGHLRSVPLEEVVKMCLQALLIHSTIASHREEIVRLNGIRLLSEIKSMWPTSVTICSMIAQIIGSLALETSSHKQLFQSGWIRVLAEWLRSTQLELSLPAARALLNMDNDGIYAKIRLEPGIYVAHPLTRDGEDEITGDAIFVHGLLGGAFRTWRQMDPGKDKSEAAPQIQQGKDESILPEATISCYTRCWPKDWLAKDTPYARILLVDYETHLSRWTEKCPLEGERRSLDMRSVEILNKLRQAGVGHQPAVWITHSMGGLLVKKLLLFSCSSTEAGHEDVCNKTKGVVFFSVPHKGASLPYLWKEYDYLLLPSTEVKELKPGSKHLLQLHADFKGLVEERGLSCLSFGEALRVNILGKRVSTVLVPPDVADPGFGQFHVVPVNHLYICKPSSRQTPLYQRLESYIRDHLKDASKLKSTTDELDAEIVMSTFPF